MEHIFIPFGEKFSIISDKILGGFLLEFPKVINVNHTKLLFIFENDSRFVDVIDIAAKYGMMKVVQTTFKNTYVVTYYDDVNAEIAFKELNGKMIGDNQLFIYKRF